MKAALVTPKSKKIGETVTFRPSPDVRTMLGRASRDHPIITAIINECLRRELVASGYARKKEMAK